MGCLSKEDKDKIRAILQKGAEEEAELIIDFTEKIQASMPKEGYGALKEWAEKKAQSFVEARTSMLKSFNKDLEKEGK